MSAALDHPVPVPAEDRTAHQRPLLEIEGLRGGYGRVEVLRGIDLQVNAGEMVALLGSNGAGKSTLNKMVCGLTPAAGGRVRFDGKDLSGAHYREVVRAGLIQVPEGRKVFPNLSVRENLELGSFTRARARRAANIEKMFDIFPRLRERMAQHAGTMSGGEQQMLAIARALMMKPRLLILDEPTLGLAPVILETLSKALHRLRSTTGLTVLLGEQNITFALPHADRLYVVDHGKIAWEGAPERFEEEAAEMYL